MQRTTSIPIHSEINEFWCGAAMPLAWISFEKLAQRPSRFIGVVMTQEWMPWCRIKAMFQFMPIQPNLTETLFNSPTENA